MTWWLKLKIKVSVNHFLAVGAVKITALVIIMLKLKQITRSDQTIVSAL